MSRRKLALTQANEMAKLERQLAKAIRPQIASLAERAAREMQSFHVEPNSLTRMRLDIRDGLIAAHITGMRRARLIAGVRRKKSIVASNFVTSILSRYRDLTQTELDFIADKYEAETIKVISNLTTRLDDGVRDALNDAIVSGVSPKAAVKGFFSKLGVTSENGYFYETLIRTQTQLAYQGAAWQQYNEPDVDEILWGYEYITVGDGRVRAAHEDMDGVTLPKLDPFWRTNWPPNGYNCRCSALPVFEPTRIRRAGSNTEPDKGFAFNSGTL